MSFPKFIAISSFCLFGFIAILAAMKKEKEPEVTYASLSDEPIEIELFQESRPEQAPMQPKKNSVLVVNSSMEGIPEADRVDELFNRHDPRFPIVETITYRSRVPWQKGRPAWLSDYAGHYKTSRHFIARSLNNSPDYFKQNIGEGDRFNVFNENKNFEFYLLIDSSRCKLWLYYLDLDLGERTLIKSYNVGLGRFDESKPSGCLTPLGKYMLGEKIVIYKPKMFGYHNNQKTEMVKVFGSRWIPFEKEIENCSAPARGFGIHGVPWVENDQEELVPDESSIGKYDSDGCIRLANDDIEELFSIIITKPTTVDIVKDFHVAQLPGVER